MDCDDVALLLADDDERTWSPVDEARFEDHLASCETCRKLAREGDDPYRWVVRVPEDALDDPDLLVLPTVDPVVFTSGSELARGGMGRITRAHDRRLGRDVALKEVLDPTMRARFEREVTITAQLQHPAIVPVYEAGAWPDGSAFYTMRLVAGGTLAERIAQTTSLETRLALLPHIVATTEALAYAHSKGVVHRDLKPGNVLVGEFGETVVIDWGLAKELHRNADSLRVARRGSSGDLTIEGSVFGTPCFMPPEQATGDDADERSDVYALGAILYNMLAGSPPYWDEVVDHDAARLVELVKLGPPRPLAELAARAPADLRAIVDRAMARDKDSRYPSAVQMAEELRRFQDGQLLRSRDYRLRDLVARWIRRHRTAVIVGAIALVATMAIGITALVNITHSRAAEREARRGAEANVVTLLVEQGRAQLLDGERDRALAYLAEAYGRGGTGVALRHLLVAATRDLELHQHTIDVAPHQITSFGFLADGRAVTVGDSSGAVIALWNHDRMIASHTIDGTVARSALSQDARRVAIVTADAHVRMLDAETGAQLWQIDDPALALPEIVFDGAGTRVLLIPAQPQNAHAAQLRDVETGELVASLDVGTGLPTSAAFADDGSRLAICDTTGAVGLWAVPSGARLPTPATMHGCRNKIVFLGKSKVVAQSADDEVDIWDLETNTAFQLTAHVSSIIALAASARAGRIATGDATGAVSLWSVDGHLIGTELGHQGALQELVFSPDGALLVAGGASQRADVWDTAALELVARIGSDHERGYDPIGALAWSHDGTQVATVRINESHAFVYRAPRGHRISMAESPCFASALGDHTAVAVEGSRLVVRRLDTGAMTHEIGILPARGEPALLDSVVVSRDDRRALAWFRSQNHASMIDLATGNELFAPDLRAPQDDRYAPMLSADGRTLLEIPRNDHDTAQVRVVDAGTGRLVRELALHHAVAGAISPDGDRIAVIATGGAPSQIIRVATGEAVALPSFERMVVDVHFDPSGTRLIICSIDTASVIDGTTGNLIAKLTGLSGAVEAGRFDADGHRVLTWNTGGTVKLWNADTGVVLASVEGVASYALAITGDGARFATGADNGSIRIWDDAGRLLEILHGDAPGLTGLAWSPDGTRLLAQTSNPYRASIWDVHLEQRAREDLVELARRASGWKVVDGLLVRAPASE